MISDETREKWVAALRSGEYKQGKGDLRKEDRFCCLGVLCDLTPEYEFLTDSNGNALYVSPFNGIAMTGELEREDLDHFGLSDEAQECLIDLNDGQAASFSAIADVIEQGEYEIASDVDVVKI